MNHKADCIDPPFGSHACTPEFAPYTVKNAIIKNTAAKITYTELVEKGCLNQIGMQVVRTK